MAKVKGVSNAFVLRCGTTADAGTTMPDSDALHTPP